jgi:hypothetical protein
MGWQLKHRAKDNKWRVWTTVSDGWITDWLTEDEAKTFLSYEYNEDYKLKVIKTYWTFPHGWSDRDTGKILDNREALIAFSEWHLEATKSEDYYAEVDKKFAELTGMKA